MSKYIRSWPAKLLFSKSLSELMSELACCMCVIVVGGLIRVRGRVCVRKYVIVVRSQGASSSRVAGCSCNCVHLFISKQFCLNRFNNFFLIFL